MAKGPDRISTEEFQQLIKGGAVIRQKGGKKSQRSRPKHHDYRKILVASGEVPTDHVKVRVETKLPSLNHAYGNNKKTGRGRFLTKQAKAYKKLLIENTAGLISESKWYFLQLTLGFPLESKGEPVERDWDNFPKLTQDAICEKLGINDCRIKKAVVEKVDSEVEYVEVDLWTWPRH